MFIRILAALLLAILPVLATASPAAACSCAYDNAAQNLERTDAAFVGQIISTTQIEYPVLDGEVSPQALSHIFEVESVIRGEFEQVTEVIAPVHGGVCGLPAVITRGARAGIFVRINDDGRFESNFCSFAGAKELLALADGDEYPPLPVSAANQFKLATNDLDQSPDGDSPLAQNPRDTNDPGESGIYTGTRALWAGAVVVILGYAVWRFFIRSSKPA